MNRKILSAAAAMLLLTACGNNSENNSTSASESTNAIETSLTEETTELQTTAETTPAATSEAFTEALSPEERFEEAVSELYDLSQYDRIAYYTENNTILAGYVSKEPTENMQGISLVIKGNSDGTVQVLYEQEAPFILRCSDNLAADYMIDNLIYIQAGMAMKVCQPAQVWYLSDAGEVIELTDIEQEWDFGGLWIAEDDSLVIGDSDTSDTIDVIGVVKAAEASNYFSMLPVKVKNNEVVLADVDKPVVDACILMDNEIEVVHPYIEYRTEDELKDLLTVLTEDEMKAAFPTEEDYDIFMQICTGRDGNMFRDVTLSEIAGYSNNKDIFYQADCDIIFDIEGAPVVVYYSKPKFLVYDWSLLVADAFGYDAEKIRTFCESEDYEAIKTADVQTAREMLKNHGGDPADWA